MIKLNLETKNKEQEIIKAYLEENASDILADKINNGVKIQKDNITLINKKTLDTFIKYACEKARKLASKDTNFACIEDKTVFGWAIHYFEEDSIEDIFYNEDGTEYKTEISTPPKIEKSVKPKPENKQATLFDLMDLSTNKEESVENINEELEEDEIVNEDNEIIDYETGKIKQETNSPIDNIDIHNQTFDKFLLKTISSLFDGKIKLK